ncbi:MAG: aspartate-semialdehyde dehydrogenase [Pseudomonadota bacterium]
MDSRSLKVGCLTFALSAFTLAACDSGVPAPGQEPLRASSPQVAEDEIVLRAQGLVAGPEAFYFAAGRSEVEAALRSILGEPTERRDIEECGAGPMSLSEYANGLVVNFQRGNLAGWTLSQNENAPRVMGDVQIATSRDEVGDVDGFAAIEGSTLGDEFAIGNAVGGFFEDDKVAMLYAGTQCFMR